VDLVIVTVTVERQNREYIAQIARTVDQHLKDEGVSADVRVLEGIAVDEEGKVDMRGVDYDAWEKNNGPQ